MRLRALLLLAAAAVVMIFANGRFAFPLAAWVAPSMLLRFVRTSPPWRAAAGAWIVLSVASYFWWLRLFPFTGVEYLAAASILGAVTALPYLLDRALSTRLTGLLRTLVLPAAFVSIELLNSVGSPYGSWGSVAYSQAGVTPLVQLLSVTGMAGVTFLVMWFASVVNEAWSGAAGGRRLLAVFAVIGVVVLAGGAIRTSRGASHRSVTAAAVTPAIPTYTVRGDRSNSAVHEALAAVRRRAAMPVGEWADFRARAAQINAELLAASSREAGGRAQLVLWSEGAGIVAREDEQRFTGAASATARARQFWLSPSYLVLSNDASGRYENKNLLIDPAGQIRWTYHKTNPVPGMESCTPGDGRIPVVPAPFGRIATVICYDADFPRLVRRAGEQGADLLLLPADDWREISELHVKMASFRAVEQGVTIVRSTSSGRSAVIDRFGRINASADYFTGERSLVARVPVPAARTLYTSTGDVAAAVLGPLLLALAIGAALRARS